MAAPKRLLLREIVGLSPCTRHCANIAAGHASSWPPLSLVQAIDPSSRIMRCLGIADLSLSLAVQCSDGNQAAGKGRLAWR